MTAGRVRGAPRVLVALIAIGTAARIVAAFASYGVQYDIDSARIVADALTTPGAGPYPTGRWPYPPGFFPAIWLADRAADATGMPFHGLVQLPAILADAALAFVVAWFLGGRGGLVAGALVALGPSFGIISGYHGQIDAVAILPAVLGVIVFLRGGPRRALYAGLLIGAGAAVKTVPIFCVLALLPAVRDRREAAVLIAAAAAVPLLALSPWLIWDFRGTVDALTANQGVPGFGGISAFLQPELTRYWSALDSEAPPVSSAILGLTDVQNLIVGGAVLAVAVLAAVRRVRPLDALVLVWLTVLAVNPNFAYQYVVWALPFLLLAGRLRETAALQAALLAPSLLLYTHADKSGWVYWGLIQLVWLGVVALWLRELRRAIATAPATEASHSPVIQGT